MVLGLNRSVYLFALLIVAVRTREETRIATGYNYVEASCFNLMPSQMMQSNMSPQAGEDAPFRARFMNNDEAMYTYRPNHEYRIIISSDKDLFMGFIANMRLARDPSVIVGRVIEPQDNNTLIKTMTCNGTNNTATQMRITQHSSVEFIWIAPADLNETVILRFGVFKNHSLFWNDLHTPCIVPVDVNLFPSICDTPMSSSSFRSSSSSSSVVLSSVSVDVSSLHVHTSSLSSSTTVQSMSTVVTTSSSSISVTQPTVTSSLSSSTQLYSSVLPTPSMSEVSLSTVIESEQPTKLIPTRSILLLSKVLTYTYTSMPSPTSVVVNTATTSNDMIIASSSASILTKYTLSTANVTDNKMTSSPINTATPPATRTTNDNENTLSAIPTAVTSNRKDSLLENTSEMIAIGIAVGFVLIIIVSQIIIVTVGCIYRRRQNNKSHSRSSSFRTLYSLDTASVRSESIRRSYRLYNREQVDLKLNIIEVDECPNNNDSSSSVPHDLTQDNNHTCQPIQPSNGDSVSRSTNIQVDVHSIDH